MPTNAPISFLFAGLPAEYCIESPQRFALDIAAGLSGYVPGQYTFFNYGNSEPAPEDRNKPWLRLNGDGTPDRWYVYSGGVWIAPNPREAAGNERMWWAGSEADLWSYDGGDGTDPSSVAPTATSGAMWERDTDYDAKFPLQAGTLPDTSTAVSPGDTGGKEVDVMPDHTHITGRFGSETGDHADDWSGLVGSSAIGGSARTCNGTKSVAESTDLSSLTGAYTKTAGILENEGMTTDLTKLHTTNMPPYRVGMWAMRTNRIYFTP